MAPPKALEESTLFSDTRTRRQKLTRHVGPLQALALTALLLLYYSHCRREQATGILSQNRDSIIGHAKDDPVGTVKWRNCTSAGHAPGAECGYIIVPLDYDNLTAGVAKIALGRYNATDGPRKGMVVYNPGGPGGLGKPMATDRGPFFQQIIGKKWDFVSFDPRGMGETEPAVNCFGTHGNYSLFKGNTILERGYDVAPDLTDKRTRDHLILQQQDADALYQTQFELCGKTMGETLQYMGTTLVVRDIDYITTALEGKDALINYYGASYGTVIGAYLVNMFPHRVGRVVIDGVVNVVDWASVPAYKWYRTWQADAKTAYKMFLDACSEAGPTKCALATTEDEDPSRIDARMEDFFHQIYHRPLAVPTGSRPTMLTNGRARIALFAALQKPRFWNDTAVAFASAMRGDGADLLNRSLAVDGFARDLERSAVSCNDNAPFPAPTPEEVVDEALDVLQSVTRFGLAVVTTEPDSGCQFWPFKPFKPFTGPWNHSLNNPILIHSNIADAATPLSSGRKIKELLGESARLAIREGPGHTSFSLNSLCTVRITQNYFEDGTLPPNEHLCPVDEKPFNPETSRALSEEDAALLEELKVLGTFLDTMNTGYGL